MGKMSHTNENNNRGFGGKSFYAALALCLIGTGAAAWLAVSSTVRDVKESQPDEGTLEPLTSNAENLPLPEETTLREEADQWSYPELQQADTKKEEVPVEASTEEPSQFSSSTVSSSSQSSDSSAASLEIAEEPVQSASSQNVLYMLPVSGEIIGKFSGGELVKDPTMGDWRTHDGIDIKADPAAPVKAAGSGTVSKTYRDGMWGSVVEITHPDGVTSIYSGLNEELSVKAGDSVEIGQTIGSVAEKITAEVALESHLHFAMKKDGSFVDPMKTMGKEE